MTQKQNEHRTFNAQRSTSKCGRLRRFQHQMSIQVLHGDCRDTLKQIPAGSVQCCVTSPPYWGLRSYLPKDHPDKAREIGSEPTPEAFIETMVTVFREVKRCLHDTGTVFLNLGDSYNGYMANQRGTGLETERQQSREYVEPGFGLRDKVLKSKDLCLIPWRVAIALQQDGWWVRSVICWHKKSCMPESVTDRPTNSWEPIFLLAKSARYFYDAEAVKEKDSGQGGAAMDFKRTTKDDVIPNQSAAQHRMDRDSTQATGQRNQRNVWSLGPEPYSEAHFATFPTEIPRRAILAGTSARGCCPKCFAPWERVVAKTDQPDQSAKGSRFDAGKTGTRDGGDRTQEGDRFLNRTVGWKPGCECKPNGGETGDYAPIQCTVLDPFGGSGTTGAVALELGRNVILCELNDKYLPLIDKRTNVTKGLALA